MQMLIKSTLNKKSGWRAVPGALLLTRGELTLVPLVGQTATKKGDKALVYTFLFKMWIRIREFPIQVHNFIKKNCESNTEELGSLVLKSELGASLFQIAKFLIAIQQTIIFLVNQRFKKNSDLAVANMAKANFQQFAYSLFPPTPAPGRTSCLMIRNSVQGCQYAQKRGGSHKLH